MFFRAYKMETLTRNGLNQNCALKVTRSLIILKTLRKGVKRILTSICFYCLTNAIFTWVILFTLSKSFLENYWTDFLCCSYNHHNSQIQMCQGTGFLTHTFSHTEKIVDSVLIRENTGQRKPVFWHILRSDSLDKLNSKYKFNSIVKPEV